MISLALTTALLLAQPTEGTVPTPAATDVPPAAASAPEAQPAPSYDDLVRRIEALEKAAQERTPLPATRSTAGVFAQNRFNPDISIIADFALVGTNLTDGTAQTLALPGFLDQSDRTGKLRGINFNYLEFAFNAAVDPYFDFVGIVTVAPSGVDVEEAFVDTRQLPFGFQLRIGKFFSAFGRLNGMHAHVWDFFGGMPSQAARQVFDGRFERYLKPTGRRISEASTANIASFISRDSIFLPRYSGVRPTIRPATKIEMTTKMSMP